MHACAMQSSGNRGDYSLKVKVGIFYYASTEVAVMQRLPVMANAQPSRKCKVAAALLPHHPRCIIIYSNFNDNNSYQQR